MRSADYEKQVAKQLLDALDRLKKTEAGYEKKLSDQKVKLWEEDWKDKRRNVRIKEWDQIASKASESTKRTDSTAEQEDRWSAGSDNKAHGKK